MKKLFYEYQKATQESALLFDIHRADPSVANYIHNLNRSRIIPSGNFDTGAGISRMNDLSVADIHGNMIDPAASVENQISGLHL